MLPPNDISSTDPNLGLNDIKTGLRFFKGFASSFGGDPDKITVGGHSSWGHMVRGEYEKTTRSTILLVGGLVDSGFDWVISGLLASPEMEGTFRAAIIQSDPMVCIAAFPPAYDKRF
jgi:carboxylesterase type B